MACEHSASYRRNDGSISCALCDLAETRALLRRTMTQIGTSSKLYLECQAVLPQTDASAEVT